MPDPFKTEQNLLPEPHSSFAGHARKDGVGKRAFAAIAKLWQPRGTTAEVPAATASRYSMRLIDRFTGKAYSMDELDEARFFRTAATAITLGPEHKGKIIVTTAADTVLVSLSAALPEGFNCGFLQRGAGLVSVLVEGVTLNGGGGENYNSADAYDFGSLLHLGEGDFMIKGDFYPS